MCFTNVSFVTLADSPRRLDRVLVSWMTESHVALTDIDKPTCSLMAVKWIHWRCFMQLNVSTCAFKLLPPTCHDATLAPSCCCSRSLLLLVCSTANQRRRGWDNQNHPGVLNSSNICKLTTFVFNWNPDNSDTLKKMHYLSIYVPVK